MYIISLSHASTTLQHIFETHFGTIFVVERDLKVYFTLLFLKVDFDRTDNCLACLDFVLVLLNELFENLASLSLSISPSVFILLVSPWSLPLCLLSSYTQKAICSTKP